MTYPTPYMRELEAKRQREATEIVCVYGTEKALMGELYRTVKALQAIKHAPDLQAIKDVLRAAKASGDTELLAMLIERATKRKKELEAL